MEVCCIAKGKEHKQYEFGSKAAIAITKKRGIIVGTASFSENIYDGKTLETIIEQTEIITGKKPKTVIVDRGFRGKKKVNGVEIVLPNRSKKETTNYQKKKARERFRRRTSIEPVIGHMKSDFGLSRNFLKGSMGDHINLRLSAAAFNFKKYINQIKKIFSIYESYFWEIGYNFL